MYLITLIIPSRLREEKTRDKVIQSAIEISWNASNRDNHMMNNFGKENDIMGKRRFKNDGDFL